MVSLSSGEQHECPAWAWGANAQRRCSLQALGTLSIFLANGVSETHQSIRGVTRWQLHLCIRHCHGCPVLCLETSLDAQGS